MIADAGAFWDALKGKVKELCKELMGKALQCERYDVTTAPNGTVIGVKQPFGATEIFIPYSGEVASAAVGDTVLVYWWNSLSNARAWCFGNGPSLSGSAVTYPIPIDKGGTGATTAEAALTALGGVSIVKLWENASPGSAFAAQTVALDLSGYAAVKITWAVYASSSGNASRFFTGEYPANTNGCFATSAYAGNMVERFFTVRSGGIDFGDGGRYYTYDGDPGVRSDVMIPETIYGVKGVM